MAEKELKTFDESLMFCFNLGSIYTPSNMPDKNMSIFLGRKIIKI